MYLRLHSGNQIYYNCVKVNLYSEPVDCVVHETQTETSDVG